MKAHKAPGHDNIRNEILISGKNHLKEPIRTLFNTILASGTFPESWCIGHIVPIFKKDDRDKVENYRGITLLSSLGKLFTTIINDRLYKYLSDNEVLKPEQGGFRKEHGTVDNIYIYLKQSSRNMSRENRAKRKTICFRVLSIFKKPLIASPGTDFQETIKDWS